MRHPSTKSLYAYWTELLRCDPIDGSPIWPDRSQVEPAAMRNWLADVFILQAGRTDAQVRYRLAGTRLCEMHGRELAGEPFAAAFAARDRPMTGNWLATLGDDTSPLLFASEGWEAGGRRVILETLVLPLRHDEAPDEKRALGITTAEHRPAWLGMVPLAGQEVTGVRVLRPWETSIARADWPVVRPGVGRERAIPNRRLAMPGRRIGHLRVLDGGLA